MRRLKFISILTLSIFLFAGLAFAGNKSPMFSRTQPGGMFAVVDETQTTGDIWFVDSGSATGANEAGYGQNPDAPFLTIDYAVGSGTASNGDWIVGMPGHAETITSATGLVIDVAGLRIIGLGQGDTRPTLTFTTSAANSHVVITGADTTIENFVFANGIDSQAEMILVTADDVTFDRCEFKDGASTSGLNAITFGAADGDSDRFTVKNCYFYQPGANNDHSIEVLFDMVGGKILDNVFYGDYDEGAIAIPAGGDANLDLEILRNVISNKQASGKGISIANAASTGMISGNRIYVDTIGNSIDPGALKAVENYVATAADVSGTLYPASTSGVGSIGSTNDTTTDSLHGKIGTDTEMADKSLYDFVGAFTGDGGAGQDDSVKASLDLAHTDLDSILASAPSGLAVTATVTSSADTTHSVYSGLTGYGNGYFVTGWTMIVIYDAGAANAAPEGEVVDITAYTSSTGTFTHGATTQLAAGDKVLIIRDELASIFQKALPAAPVANSLAYRLSQYLASGDGDWATGTALPSNISLYDTIKYLGYLTTAVAADGDLSAMVADASALSHIMTKGADTSDYAASTDSLEAIRDHLDGTTVLGGIQLDHLAKTDTTVAADADLTTYVADGSILSHAMTKGADTSDYAASTDSLEALSDKAGAFTGDGGAAQDDSVKASLDLAHTDLDAILADSAALDDFKEKAVSKAITTIANGNNDLFAVANGPIKILEIVAYVVTEIGAEGCLISYNIDPTAPATDTVFGTDGTALEINADAVGTLYRWDGVIANDLTAITNGVALGNAAFSGLIVPAGMIELTAVHDGTITGAITVYMRYVPLATGVTVTAQ